MASLIDLFPRRPLKLRSDSRRTRQRILLLVFAGLLALPALYWGYQSLHGAMLRADLRARGVRAAETLGAEATAPRAAAGSAGKNSRSIAG